MKTTKNLIFPMFNFFFFFLPMFYSTSWMQIRIWIRITITTSADTNYWDNRNSQVLG